MPINSPQTPVQPIQVPDITQALLTIQSSLFILLIYYKPYIKLLIWSILVYAFYKLGNLSIRDNILTQKKYLYNLLRKEASYKNNIPKRIRQIQSGNKFVIGMFGLVLLALGVSYYMKYKPIMQISSIILKASIASFSSVMLILFITKKYLTHKLESSQSLHTQISVKQAQFQQSLGQKVTLILKHYLCKSSYTKLYSNNPNECIKKQCQQLRTLYKQRDDSMKMLIDQVIGFQFCSNCRKRPVFDQYLTWESKIFQTNAESQEEQLKEKIQYLLHGLQSMKDWILQTNPCNCSKLYWNLSTQKIIEYKKGEKATQLRIKQLQTKYKK